MAGRPAVAEREAVVVTVPRLERDGHGGRCRRHRSPHPRSAYSERTDRQRSRHELGQFHTWTSYSRDPGAGHPPMARRRNALQLAAGPSGENVHPSGVSPRRIRALRLLRSAPALTWRCGYRTAGQWGASSRRAALGDRTRIVAVLARGRRHSRRSVRGAAPRRPDLVSPGVRPRGFSRKPRALGGDQVRRRLPGQPPPEIFSSASGITIGDQTAELAEYFGSMIVMDDPRHTACATSCAARSPAGGGPDRGFRP